MSAEIHAALTDVPDGHEVCVAYDDLRGERGDVGGDRVLHAASLMKVPVMIELFRRVDRGEISLDTRIELENRFASIVDGSAYSLNAKDDSDAELYAQVGKQVSLGELCRRMIDASSNLATNTLVGLLDAKRIQATIEELGTKHTLVLRGVEDQKAYDRGLSNRTTARDMATLLGAIVKQRAASPRSCRAMLAILEGQKHRSMLPHGLPDETRIAHKTGQITRIHHDCGLFWKGDRPFVIAVLTKGYAREADSAAIGARVAQACWRGLP